MLRRSWHAGLQLEVAKRNVTAAQKVVIDHNATLALCGIAAGGLKTHCTSCAKRRIGLQKLQCKRRGSWEAGQSRSGPDKWLPRGASAKRPFSEE